MIILTEGWNSGIQPKGYIARVIIVVRQGKKARKTGRKTKAARGKVGTAKRAGSYKR